MSVHKNNNNAVGNYGIYEITVFGKRYKIGKADLDRITMASGDPTRIHQQVRRLRKKYGNGNVFYVILESLFGVTTREAKAFEYEILRLIYEHSGVIPEGNKNSFKP